MSEQENPGVEYAEAAAPIETVQSEQQNSVESTESKMVPLEALQAEREQRQNREEELRVMRDHVSLMQSQQNRQEPAKEGLDALADEDVLTVGEAKKYMSNMNKQYQMGIEELKMTQKNPDYQDVVSKYLPEVLKQNPKLRQTLTDSQDYELAYYLAKNSDAYKATSKKTKKSADAERIVQNSQQAGSLSGVGSVSPMNQAKRYKDMNDADFKSMVNRNMGGI